METYIKLLIQL